MIYIITGWKRHNTVFKADVATRHGLKQCYTGGSLRRKNGKKVFISNISKARRKMEKIQTSFYSPEELKEIG